MSIMETGKMLRVVIDTSVLVSSLIGKGAAFTTIERFKQNHFIAYINGHLMEEYDKKLNELLKTGTIKDSDQVSKLLNEFRARAVCLRIPIDTSIRSTDPKDNSLLEVALVGGLNFIITNDSRDLLSLNGNPSLGPTKVIRPEEFIATLNALD